MCGGTAFLNAFAALNTSAGPIISSDSPLGEATITIVFSLINKCTQNLTHPQKHNRGIVIKIWKKWIFYGEKQ
jgi:hypothetical protein